MITDPATSAVAPSPAMPSTPLTPRECEILSWLRMGKSNWAIGQILGISEHTVKHMVSNILRKYGVLSRYHLMHPPT